LECGGIATAFVFGSFSARTSEYESGGDCLRTPHPAPCPLEYNAPVLIEAEAIPYEPALLRGERLLVLAPHPDDEVIACGGLVALHLREGRAVRVVVATDGAQAGSADVRQEESRQALALFSVGGVGKSPLSSAFLGWPDRGLDDSIAPKLREELVSFRPDLILVPAPIEIHPDHLALARIFCELVQRDETLFADLAVARVAFYEVGQPLRPNAIVDISDVAEAKYAAIAEHKSQLAQRDYVAYARGLNAYRAMTLPPETKYAEGYYVVELKTLWTTPVSELRRLAGAPKELTVSGETVPVSVVIRTKNRPALLDEAIASVRTTGYPCEVVVVNDGGSPLTLDGVKLVQHETSRGRAEAANAGVGAAANAFVVFLDDDDLFYPEHLATLAGAVSSSHAAWYTDAVSAYLSDSASRRTRIYAQSFDRELLKVDNYIPLPTVLIRRDQFLDLDGFDASFDLFEDWDFLLRLAQRGDFLRIPRITCEIRHFAGGTSVVLAAPEGSEEFRAAKLRIWEKHGVDAATFARVYEKQKRRMTTTYADAVEIRGQADDLRRDMARVEREKAQVIAQNAAAADTINGYALRVRELEGAANALSAIAADYENKTLQLERLTRELEVRAAENDQIRAVNAATHEELQRARVEIERLNGLLTMIYGSRTWKLHTMVEKVRGRG
jgi:LmbE family N-acetylglucosaminyl deacetylase/glycosyltransferase involved in cell wall biosynthesis